MSNGFTSGLRRHVCVFALLACALPLAAASGPPKSLAKPKPGRMADARVNLPESQKISNKARAAETTTGFAKAEREVKDMLAARTALKRSLPGLEVKYSGLSGGVDTVSSRMGALTGAAPGRSGDAIVRDFLGTHGKVYGLGAADLNDVVTLGESHGGESGLRMVRMEQRIDGLPVFQSETRFLLDAEGRLIKSVGRMIPGARGHLARPTAGSALTPADAVVRLLQSEGKTASAASFVVARTRDDGAIELNENDDYVLGTITAREMLFPVSPGVLVKAWSLVVFASEEADWYALIDQETGALLWRKNIRAFASTHDARFRVYVQADGTTPADSPAPQSPSAAVSGAGTQFPEIAPVVVNMSVAQDIVASPNGWINDCPGGVCTANETQTLGNNAIVCLDRAGTANVCDTDAASVVDGNGRPTGNPDANSRNRDFLGTAPRDFQTGYLPPPQGGNPEAGQTATGNGASGTNVFDQFRRGAMTQLFYITNWYHDQVYQLGFDEAAGNFQATNFTGMGLGGDRVNVDAQDASGTNNANFATPPDGTSGRCQMFRFTGPTIDRDGGLDAEIVIHELTHGLSNRLVGNAAGLNWDPAAGMGEGWSDFFALSLLNNTNADVPTAQYASGAYATYKVALPTYTDNYVYGIRRFPYSTTNTINPMTWADVDDVTNDLSGGIPPTPLTFFNAGGALEVHNSGEIWAGTLWEVRGRIIADPAGANGNVPTGNTTALRLVMNGLKMTPVDPSFTDARDAIVDADCAISACANEESIWGGFADRGLGYGARTPYNVIFGLVAGHMGVHESFLIPYLDVVDANTDVTINDASGNNNGAIDPGEAIQLTVELTNPWRAAGKAIAGATAVLSTSTPGVTIFDNASVYGAIAPQGSATGDSFLITVDPSVLCGSSIVFTITTTSTLGVTSDTFRVRVGNASGTDPVVTYTGDPNPDLAPPDNTGHGVTTSMNITDDFEIADLDFRIDSATHDFAGDFSFMLHSPENIGVDFVSLIDALTGDFGGTDIANMVIDDDLPNVTANDMVQADFTMAPYTKSWLPVFNAEWPTLAGFPPEDAIGNLSRYDGASTQGTWSVHAADQVGADVGTLNTWSILVTPVHRACTIFAPSAVASATKTVSGSFTAGGAITYTITLTNTGTDAQGDNAGNEFTDTLPASLTLVSASSSSGTATTAVNTVNWNGSLAPLGGSVTITINATINAGTEGSSISNQGQTSFDSNNDNVNDAAGVTDDPGTVAVNDATTFMVGGVAGVATLTATKTVTGSFTQGGAITYTVTISNSGNAASLDNAGNEFTDVLPSSVTLVSATANSGTATPNIGTNTVTWTGSVPAGGSVIITINAMIDADATGTISNQGSVTYDANLDGTNDTTTQTDDPGQAGAANPTNLEVAGAPADIPTLSEYGLMALVLALVSAAWLTLRRRKVTV